MNGERHGKCNLMKKYHALEMGKSGMRPSWTYKLGQNIISIWKEDKNLWVVIEDNLSTEKHIDIIFGDTFKILRNIWMSFNFLDKDTMKKIITTNVDYTKNGIRRSNMVPAQENALVEIGRNTENNN